VVEDRAEVLAGADLRREYAERRGALLAQPRRVAALVGVTLALGNGERVGLVGGSGAGKSTLVRVLAGLEAPDAGRVRFRGRELRALEGDARARFRRAVQVVFQDPGSALDPRQRVGSAVGEPLAIHGLARGAAARDRAAGLLAAVGLPAGRQFAERLPHELSGGERQRVVIARALACEPEVLLLDEPVASLDVSIRGQVLNLLLDLGAGLGLTMLLVAHDILLVRAACDRLVVMYRGRVVEEGTAAEVFSRPAHPYTRALLDTGEAVRVAGAAVPVVAGAAVPVLAGGATGCPYLDRCPRRSERCAAEPPLTAPESGSARRVACWNALVP